MKIVFVISSLGPGGAERVVALMSSYWAEKKHEIHIITFENQGSATFYNISPSVHIHQLNIGGSHNKMATKLAANIRYIFVIREVLSKIKPEAVISFIDRTNVLTLFASMFTKIPVIVTEHINCRQFSPGLLWSFLRILVYPFAYRVIGVSEGVLRSLPRLLQKKGAAIPNPIKLQTSAENASVQGDGKTIISIGRLEHQKGFDILIAAFAQIRAKYPGWHVDIWGEGSLREDLLKDIAERGLNGQVKLRGLTKNSFGELSKSTIFVLPSRFEGFGIVLCEAMACGLAVISSDCPSGPAEIIHHGIDGILFPSEDVNALAKALEELITDGSKRMALGRNARKSVEQFELSHIMAQWDELLRPLQVKNEERT
jgi:GalNAc-alpha-(1->4)-GalNAc-alpha-(1->3)-diNAcBac-PP-undecaprenol alpha-1,4-N-acetyl-D-galactosaminyltransferase